MPNQAQPIKTNFTAGEISPRLLGRVDLARYFNACRILENFLVLAHGGIIARPGTRYAAEVKDSTKNTHLITFQFSETESYILEMGDLYVRFFANNGQVISGGSPYEIVSPYAHGDIAELFFAQSADVMYLCHKSYPVYKLSRLGNTNWTLTEVDFKNGPYLATNTTATTITPSGTVVGTTITLTASTAIFQNGHIGSYWRVGGSNGYVKITGVSSPTSATAVVKATLAGGATTDWAEGAWSAVRGYPGAISFYEERLWLGGTNHQVQTLWGSRSGDYENYLAGTNPDDAVVNTISTDDQNLIQWLNAGKTLATGTVAGEFNGSGNSSDDAITPDNFKVPRETTYGSAKIRPVRIGSSVIFVQRAKRKLREFVYNFQEDGYIGSDLTIMSEHILRPGVKDLAYQQEPDSHIWIAREDGQAAVLTFQKDQQVYGWARQIIGGSFNGSWAMVDSVATKPDTNQDQTWLIVRRTINGQTKKYVEYLTEPFYGETEAEKKLAVQLDSSLTYNGVPVSSVSGLTHLIGQTVGIFADGKYLGTQVVPSSGIISLGALYSIVTIGLGYVPKVRSVNFEPGNPLGTSQGKNIKCTHVVVRMYQTLGGYVGRGESVDGSDMEEVVFNESGDTMDRSPDLFTGDKRVPFPNGYDIGGWVQYEQRQPFPATILAFMPEYKVHT